MVKFTDVELKNSDVLSLNLYNNVGDLLKTWAVHWNIIFS